MWSTARRTQAAPESGSARRRRDERAPPTERSGMRQRRLPAPLDRPLPGEASGRPEPSRRRDEHRGRGARQGANPRRRRCLPPAAACLPLTADCCRARPPQARSRTKSTWSWRPGALAFPTCGAVFSRLPGAARRRPCCSAAAIGRPVGGPREGPDKSIVSAESRAGAECERLDEVREHTETHRGLLWADEGMGHSGVHVSAEGYMREEWGEGGARGRRARDR